MESDHGYYRRDDELLPMLKAELNNLLDNRKPGNNSQYTVEEACVSAFSVFMTQSPSFLEHQPLMKTEKGRDNAQSLLGIESNCGVGCVENLF